MRRERDSVSRRTQHQKNNLFFRVFFISTSLVATAPHTGGRRLFFAPFHRRQNHTREKNKQKRPPFSRDVLHPRDRQHNTPHTPSPFFPPFRANKKLGNTHNCPGLTLSFRSLGFFFLGGFLRLKPFGFTHRRAGASRPLFCGALGSSPPTRCLFFFGKAFSHRGSIVTTKQNLFSDDGDKTFFDGSIVFPPLSFPLQPSPTVQQPPPPPTNQWPPPGRALCARRAAL